MGINERVNNTRRRSLPNDIRQKNGQNKTRSIVIDVTAQMTKVLVFANIQLFVLDRQKELVGA
jgi:hypothetical protein